MKLKSLPIAINMKPVVAIVLALTLYACTEDMSTEDSSSQSSSATSESESPEVSTSSTTSQPSGPNLTKAQENAVDSAKDYLEFMDFSRQGLIDQLSSEYGDQYSVADATIAVDSLVVDWNAEAAESAKSYLEFQSFSCQGLIDQLSSEFGEQFTLEQATYGAQQTGIC